MSIRNRFKDSKWIQNVSFVLVGKIVAMVFYQLFDIVVARKLSIEGYSEWAYFFSVLSIFFYTGWLGVNASSRVFILKAEGADDRAACLKASLFVRLIVSLSVSAVILIVAPFMASLFGYPDKYPNLLTLIYFSVFIVFINSYIDFFKNLFQAIETFDVMCMAIIVEYCGYLVFAFLFLNIDRDVKLVAIAYLAAGIATLLFDLIMMIKRTERREGALSLSLARKIIKYAVPMAFTSIGAIILAEIDIVMLGLFGTKLDVSIYSISKHISDRAVHVNESLIMGTIASLAIINHENIEEKINQFKKINHVNISASIITSVLMTSCFVPDLL